MFQGTCRAMSRCVMVALRRCRAQIGGMSSNRLLIMASAGILMVMAGCGGGVAPDGGAGGSGAAPSAEGGDGGTGGAGGSGGGAVDGGPDLDCGLTPAPPLPDCGLPN